MGELISVIIPVYNVEKYIDQCIESIENQTYRNLEIILIYDESQDNTLEKCKKWETKDHRIRLVINLQRRGLGAARNVGLSMAEGEYIIYLDSDDWMGEGFIEKLYKEISEANADYVSSRGYYEVNEKETIVNHAVPAGSYCDERKDILLVSDHVCVWKKIYRKKWLEESGLINPPLFYYEDWGMYPTVIRQAKKVRVIDEAGIYYRYLREGSLSNEFVSKGMLSAFEMALKYIFDYLEKHKLRKKPDKYLAYYCIRDYYHRLGFAGKSNNLEALQTLKDIKDTILVKEFGEFEIEKYHYVAFGSFSLRWEIHRGVFEPERLNRHYCFSSIISAMSRCQPVKLYHKNAFRQKQIEDDINSKILSDIKQMGHNGMLFIDFLEERYDLMELADDQYLTMSEAFAEADKDKSSFGRIVKWGSSEYMDLWKRKCLKFIDYLKEYLRGDQIIYVANRMSLCYGDFNKTKRYEQWEHTDRINKVLSEMERYFLDHFQGIITVQPDIGTAFTDKDFRLGCDPQYMNNVYYSMAGVEIFSQIMKRSK